MSFAKLCVVGIIATLPFGLAFLFAPEAVGSLYGIGSWTAGTLFVARLLGIGFLFMAGAVFAARPSADRDFRRRLSACFGIASALGAVVSANSTLGGGVNAMGWTAVALYGFFTLAWGSIALRRSG